MGNIGDILHSAIKYDVTYNSEITRGHVTTISHPIWTVVVPANATSNTIQKSEDIVGIWSINGSNQDENISFNIVDPGSIWDVPVPGAHPYSREGIIQVECLFRDSQDFSPPGANDTYILMYYQSDFTYS